MLKKTILLAIVLIVGVISTSCGPSQAQLNEHATEVAAEIFGQATMTAESQATAVAQARATLSAEADLTATAESRATATAEAQPRHTGLAGDYVPRIDDMPGGFSLDPSGSGPDDDGNGYLISFTNLPNAFTDGDPMIVLYHVYLLEHEQDAKVTFRNLTSDAAFEAWLEMLPLGSDAAPTGRMEEAIVPNVDESIGFSASGIGTISPDGRLQSSFEIILRDSNLIARVNLIGMGTDSQVRMNMKENAFYFISLVTQKLIR